MKVNVTIRINEENEILGFCNEQGSVEFLKNKSGKGFKIFEAELEQVEAFNQGELKAKLENNNIVFYEKQEETENDSDNTDIQENQPETSGV